MSDLKPCPCCGSSDVGGASGIVHCYSCRMSTDKMADTEIAERVWNNRPAENKIKADAVREAAYHVLSTDVGYGVKSKNSRDSLITYANKLERGE